MLNGKLLEIIKKNNVDLKEENVTIAFDDGYVNLSLEDGNLKINVEFVDRVIKEEGSLESILKM